MVFGVVLVVVRTSRLKLSTDILAALEWELGTPSSPELQFFWACRASAITGIPVELAIILYREFNQ